MTRVEVLCEVRTRCAREAPTRRRYTDSVTRNGARALTILLFLAVLAVVEGLLPGDPSEQSSTPDATIGEYDIVYVRMPSYGDPERMLRFAVFHPARLKPGADLVLPNPHGSKDVLVAGGYGAVTDSCVAFDGEWVSSSCHDLYIVKNLPVLLDLSILASTLRIVPMGEWAR